MSLYLLPADPYLLATDGRVGGDPEDPSDQAAILQAGWDLAATLAPGGVPFLIPAGQWQCLHGLVRPAGASANGILGAAPTTGLPCPTQIYFDLSPDEWAISLGGNGEPWAIADMNIIATGSAGAPPGVDPTPFNGVKFDARGRADGLGISGFKTGAGVLNDHGEWYRCNLGGNGYAMNWLSGSLGLGDLLIERCFLENCAYASVGVAADATIAQAHFRSCHLGFSPYAFHRYGVAGAEAHVWLANVAFHNCSFEGASNGLIYDEPGDGIINGMYGLPFADGGSMFTSVHTWAGKAMRAAIETHVLRDVHLWHQGPIGSAAGDTGGKQADGTPTARYAMRANWYDGVTIHNVDGDFTWNLASLGDDPVNAPIALEYRDPRALVSFGKATATVTQWDLLERTGLWDVQPWQGGYPVGFAARAASSGQPVPVAQRGLAGFSARVGAGVSIAQDKLLKPDPDHAGCVIEAAGATDGPIVARSLAPDDTAGGVQIEALCA